MEPSSRMNQVDIFFLHNVDMIFSIIWTCFCKMLAIFLHQVDMIFYALGGHDFFALGGHIFMHQVDMIFCTRWT